MAKFDIYVNPNKTARHSLYVDVQSDFVRLSTRWCIPLSLHLPPKPVIQGAQAQRHAGEDQPLLRRRKMVYEAAKARHPQRWSGPTRNWTPIHAVHLNPANTANNDSKRRAA